MGVYLSSWEVSDGREEEILIAVFHIGLVRFCMREIICVNNGIFSEVLGVCSTIRLKYILRPVMAAMV